MKYNLLIAEDEKICRVSIANEIQRNIPDFVVYQAANGQEALDLLTSTKIDCMILDIKMPKLTGIDLLKKLKELKCDQVLTIILSGFNEFEYAKSALQNNVVDYILKPVTPTELRAVCEKLLVKLEERQKEKLQYEALRKAVEEAKPMIKNQLLQNLVSGHYSTQQLYQQAEFLNINLNDAHYLCAVLENRQTDEQSVSDFEEDQIIMMRLINLIKESSNRVMELEVFQLQSDQVILLFHFGDEIANPFDTAMALLQQIREVAEENLNIQIAIGVGTIQSELSQVELSYFHAQNALRFTTLYGDTVSYEATDFCGKKRCFEFFDTSDIAVLLKTGDQSGVKAFTKQLLLTAEKQSIGTTSLYILCYKLQTVVIQILDECGMDIFQYFRPEELSFSALMELKTFDQVKHWVNSLVDFAMEHINEVYVETQHHAVEAAKRYIQENYQMPLNTTTIADQLGYSTNYLGQVFRKAVGVSVNEYICDIRLQQAKRLLLNSTHRVSEISDLTGFSTNQYFGTVFKKKIGATPKEYREHHLKGK